MELNVTERKNQGLAQKRRDGFIPAVLYGPKDDAISIELEAHTFLAFLRNIKKENLEGSLPNTVFSLKLGKKKIKALVKDIQYHRVDYSVLHLDFMRLYDDVETTMKVPIRMQKSDSCVGVKAGGVLRQVKRHVKVKCLPKAIPEALYLDVSGIELNGSARLSAVSIPKGVECLGHGIEVIAVVGKR